MNLPKSYILKPDQLADPVLWRGTVPIPEDRFLPTGYTVKMLWDAFGPGKNSRLETWQRDPLDPDGPHWIGVRHGVKLHIDPRYPRYTHQLIVHNDGWAIAGIKSQLSSEPWRTGTVFCLDTHSPHQLMTDRRLCSVNKGLYYLAASLDSSTPIPEEQAVPRLLAFIQSIKP